MPAQPALHPTFTAAQIRAAEQPLLDSQTEPDQLMRSAAHAVAKVARMMLGEMQGQRVLVIAGPGGNGGDALYAGAELAGEGFAVEAYLTAGDATNGAQRRALEAFRAAGSAVTDFRASHGEYDLAVDGITGIGGTPGLREELRPIVDFLVARRGRTRVLAVDVPSGVAADTGEVGELHVTADVTVTFGGWRRAHVLAAECGLPLLADIGIGERRLHGELRSLSESTTTVTAARAATPELNLPEGIITLDTPPGLAIEPDAKSDKYSGGVVGIRAGSGQYPGAAILSVAGAVNATPAMVRYAGPQALEVVRAHPEVVATATLQEAGRVQAWVFGPGAGTDGEAAAELAWILGQEVPVLIDADGLTLLASHPNLRALVVRRAEATVLTPHDGELERLRKAAGVQAAGRVEETVALARGLECTVIRKGRATLIAPESDPELVIAVDAGHSWAATPGSGDVLSGVLGAVLAMPGASDIAITLASGVATHQIAAKLAAATPYGNAAAPASRIAGYIRSAVAKLNAPRD